MGHAIAGKQCSPVTPTRRGVLRQVKLSSLPSPVPLLLSPVRRPESRSFRLTARSKPFTLSNIPYLKAYTLHSSSQMAVITCSEQRVQDSKNREKCPKNSVNTDIPKLPECKNNDLLYEPHQNCPKNITELTTCVRNLGVFSGEIDKTMCPKTNDNEQVFPCAGKNDNGDVCSKTVDESEWQDADCDVKCEFDNECCSSQGFFRRSIQQKIQYRPCTKNQQCSILRINRNRCQYCRLKKCIAVGMSRDGKFCYY